MARAYKRHGCCAIVVTDHFFNGNTAIRGNYPWDVKISMFWKGYEDAKREGDKIGLDVYFGFEFCNMGNEFLIYNYDVEKLRAYPEIMTDNIEKVLTNIRNAGGFIIHAHPFRNEFYIQNPGRMFPGYVDAVEVINTHNRTKESNRLAMDYAEEYNLIKFGGSDTHSAHPQDGGMLFERKPESLYDIIDMAKKEECVILGEQYLI
jgi:predicted metal-dependent phosphoesterase TrpH